MDSSEGVFSVSFRDGLDATKKTDGNFLVDISLLPAVDAQT